MEKTNNELLAESFFNDLFKIGQKGSANVFETMKDYMNLQVQLTVLLDTVYSQGIDDGIEKGKAIQFSIKKN